MEAKQKYDIPDIKTEVFMLLQTSKKVVKFIDDKNLSLKYEEIESFYESKLKKPIKKNSSE